ncbi:uncharacterized protein YALI1_D07315g [Yarrowia lipolytica]|uniref:Uncharacterized protein n=1 Tax=Yarrowia lipolytica TaxID=4952 RepID=A0A1D8NDD7_YARLL|nr:hypothetical protein YALI1_D07315g [Yarrowia lipolytica]
MCRVEDRPTHRLHLVHSTTYLTPTPRYHLSLTRLLLIPLKPPKLAQLDVVLVQAILGHLHALLFQFLLLLPHLVLSPQRHFALGGDNAPPRHVGRVELVIGVGGQSLERRSDLPRVGRCARQKRNVAVGGYPARGNRLAQLVHCNVKRLRFLRWHGGNVQKAEYSIVHIEEYKLESKVRSRVRSRAGTQGSILDEHFFFFHFREK